MKPIAKSLYTSILLMILSLCLVSCFGLQTRRDMSPITPKMMGDSPTPSPKAQARADLDKQAMEEKLRQLLGRIEELEHEKSLAHGQDRQKLNESENKIQSLESRIKILEQSLIEQDTKIKDYELQLAQGAQQAAASAALVESNEKPQAKSNNKEQGLLARAEQSFEQKDYKKAILEYNEYRDSNPKSKKLSLATYRIAVSFHELGMKEEAKAFYQELLDKYPKSAEASKAKFRLKQLK